MRHDHQIIYFGIIFDESIFQRPARYYSAASDQDIVTKNHSAQMGDADGYPVGKIKPKAGLPDYGIRSDDAAFAYPSPGANHHMVSNESVVANFYVRINNRTVADRHPATNASQRGNLCRWGNYWGGGRFEETLGNAGVG